MSETKRNVAEDRGGGRHLRRPRWPRRRAEGGDRQPPRRRRRRLPRRRWRWAERIDGARVADGKDAAAALLADAERDAALCRVVGPYLIDVTPRCGRRVRPATYRERIRAFGPTIHPQFGKLEATG